MVVSVLKPETSNSDQVWATGLHSNGFSSRYHSNMSGVLGGWQTEKLHS